MKKFAIFVIRYRAWMIVSTVFITLVLGIFLKDLKINPDVTTYLPKSDSAVKLFNYIGEQYSASSMAMIILESDNVFSAKTIKNIRDLTDSLKTVDGVNFVTSLTNVVDIKKTKDGLEIGKLIDEYELPQTAADLNKIREYTLSKDMYAGKLVSKDCRYTLLVCRLSEGADDSKVSKELKEKVRKLNLPEKVYFTGVPFQLLSITEYILKDLWLLTPLIILVVAITLFVSFRSIRGILLPILSVGMGTIWTMGLMSIFGVRLTPISDAIPVVLFAVGSAYGIHVINKFKQKVHSPEHKIEESKKALGEVGLAVLLAGVTTFFGFMSFCAGAYLTIIPEFGIFCSLGVLFILLISLTFIPAVLSYMKPKVADIPAADNKKHRLGINPLLDKISASVVKKPKTYVIIGLLIIVLFSFAIPFIDHKIDILNYFKPDTDIRVSANILNSEFGGSLPIDILVKGDLQDPEVLGEMKKMQHFLDGLKNVQHSQSVADLIEEMNDAIDEGKKLPDSKSKVSNLWFMIEGEEIMKQLVNSDKTEGIIQATITNTDAKTYHLIDKSIAEYLKGMHNPKVKFYQTGMQTVYSHLDGSMIRNLFQSLVLSLILIFFCMFFMLRSVKGALMGMIPLGFTIIFIFGFMGITGIALDIATILIASITVGAGIDYSIHFVTAYTDYIKMGYSIPDAIRDTLRTSGKAIIINVVTIILGFLVLLFANMIPLQQFGILIAVTMFCSGFGAITLLPAVIFLTKSTLVKQKKVQ